MGEGRAAPVQRPLLVVLTAGYLLFVGWLTLTPAPIGPQQQRLIVRVLDALHERGLAGWLDYSALEFTANVALFVPLGLAGVLLCGVRRWWAVALACVALTVGIESAQHLIPGRVSDVRDLVSNSMGGLLGVGLGALVLARPVRGG